jgi:hypothetical protein
MEQLLIAVLQDLGGESGGAALAPDMTEEYLDQQYAGLELLLGFNVQRDLFRQLTGEYGFAITSLNILAPAGLGAVLVSEVADPPVVGDSLAALGLLAGALTSDGVTIERVTVGANEVSQVTLEVEGEPVTVHYGIVGDQLVVSVGNALVEYALGWPDALSDNPDYQEAVGYLPPNPQGIAYLDVPTIAQLGTLLLGGLATEIETGLTDAGDRCAEFAAQEEAQTAYDADPAAQSDLDTDFDDVACEDYFDAVSDDNLGVALDFSINVGALAVGEYEQDGMAVTSGILVIPDES